VFLFLWNGVEVSVGVQLVVDVVIVRTVGLWKPEQNKYKELPSQQVLQLI